MDVMQRVKVQCQGAIAGMIEQLVCVVTACTGRPANRVSITWISAECIQSLSRTIVTDVSNIIPHSCQSVMDVVISKHNILKTKYFERSLLIKLLGLQYFLLIACLSIRNFVTLCI